MKKLVYRHLSEFYYVNNNYVYYKSSDIRVYYGLIKSLHLIFNLSLKQSKSLLKGWFIKQNKGSNFYPFWCWIHFVLRAHGDAEHLCRVEKVIKDKLNLT